MNIQTVAYGQLVNIYKNYKKINSGSLYITSSAYTMIQQDRAGNGMAKMPYSTQRTHSYKLRNDTDTNPVGSLSLSAFIEEVNCCMVLPNDDEKLTVT